MKKLAILLFAVVLTTPVAFGNTEFPRNEKHLLQVRENCALWDTSPYKAIWVTWSGQCKDGWANGSGRAVFNYPVSGSVYATGNYHSGKANGYWEIESELGNSSGFFYNGDFSGEWNLEFDGITVIGSFKNNQMHGTWKAQTPNGETLNLEFVDGKPQE